MKSLKLTTILVLSIGSVLLVAFASGCEPFWRSEDNSDTSLYTLELREGLVKPQQVEGGKTSILLEGIDLLDKNNGFAQVSDINYMAQSTSNTIGRLVMLTFRYRFNQLGAGR